MYKQIPKRLMMVGCFIAVVVAVAGGQVVARGAGVATGTARNVAKQAVKQVEQEPDVFSGDFLLAILTLAVFVLLLVALGKWAWKPLLASLQKREDSIRQSLQDAQQAKEEAEKALAEYKAQLEAARKEATEIIKQGRAEAVVLAEELKRKAQQEAQQSRERALRDIDAAKVEALREISGRILDISTDMAGRITGKVLRPEDHRELLDKTLAELERSGIDN